jgi:hypothetical protein
MEGIPYLTKIILIALHLSDNHAQLLSTTLENLISEPLRISSSRDFKEENLKEFQ